MILNNTGHSKTAAGETWKDLVVSTITFPHHSPGIQYGHRLLKFPTTAAWTIVRT